MRATTPCPAQRAEAPRQPAADQPFQGADHLGQIAAIGQLVGGQGHSRLPEVLQQILLQAREAGIGAGQPLAGLGGVGDHGLAGQSGGEHGTERVVQAAAVVVGDPACQRELRGGQAGAGVQQRRDVAQLGQGGGGVAGGQHQSLEGARPNGTCTRWPGRSDWRMPSGTR